MFKNLLSAVGWGELPNSFGFSVGEKVDLPFSWQWVLHKGTKKSDGSVVSIFICGKKDLDSQQVAAAKNAVQMAKSLRHTHIIRALDSIETEGGFYLVTEEVIPLLSPEAAEPEEKQPAVWGLYQAFEALSFLHQSGFTHGLFGPCSIFVTKKGEYRLGGFELCRKGADAQALVAQRRNCSPGLVGWPDPPSCLLDGQAPSSGVDFWGAALTMAYVFGSAKTGARGTDFRMDMTRASQDLPPELRKPFADLAKPGPLRGRSPIAELLQLEFFQQHASIRVMCFLGSLHIRSSNEKDAFFENLPGLLDSVPISLQTRQVLPDLLEAQKFPGQEAAQVLPSILKIGIRLKDEEFKEKVAPLVAQLFACPDRAIRFRLLSSIGEMIDHLDDAMINDKIFPECVNGFTDSNGPIREATVKSLIFFVPRLKPKTVEGRVVKLLVKLMQDPEASIRTNAVICSGRISSHVPKAVANQTLLTVLGAGFKDPFAPCRIASLQTLVACAALFSCEEIATRMLPGVCQRLVDPEPSVADTAFTVLSSLQQIVRQQIEERRASAGQPTEDLVAAQGAASKDAGWSSWAMSTVGSVVGNQLMGSMGKAKIDSSGNVSSAPSSSPSASTLSASPPAPPPTNGMPAPPRQAASSASAPGRGMALGGSSRPAAGSSSAPTPGPVAPGSDGWGDSDEGSDAGAAGAADAGDAWGASPSTGAAAAVADAWGGLGDDFFDEIGGKGGLSVGSAREEPAPVAAPTRRAPPAAAAATKAATAPAPKAKAVPKASTEKISKKDDDDFWKEFDM